MSSRTSDLYEFGPYRLDVQRRVFTRENRVMPLAPKTFELLLLLVQSEGRAFSKHELMAALWPDTFVEEANLSFQISMLRKALGEGGSRWIETVPKHGYRFAADVEAIPWDEDHAPGPPAAEVSAVSSPTAISSAANIKATRKKWIATLGAVLLLAAAFYTVIVRGRLSEAVRPPVAWRGAVPAAPSSGTPGTTTSIAVLPLRNLTGDARQDWFADAITEELTTALSRIRAIRVISGISARHYKGSDKTAPEIARELGGIDWLVDGSVTRENGRVRIGLYLDEVTSNRRVWSDSYERPLGDSLDLLDEIARRVALEIGATMTGAPQSRSTMTRSVKAAAYESYLHGLYFRDRQMDGGCIQAERYLRQSIAIDPTFAQPHAALAYCYGANRLNGSLSVSEGLSKGHGAIARALELDGQLADAHVTLALIRHRTEYDWAGAERSLTRALELNPRHAEGLVRYGELLYLTGKIEEGLSMIRRGVALVPFSVDYRVILGYAFYNLRRYDEAIVQFQHAEELDSSRAYPSWGLALTHALQGHHDQAVAEYVNAMRLMVLPERAAWATHLLEAAYQRGGWQEFWRTELELAEEGNQNPGTVWKPRFARRHVNFEMARRFARLRETERTLAWLEAAYRERESIMVCVNVEPLFDGLRSQPRFQDLVRRVGLKP